MATMYFAKLNINSKIYDLYNEPEKYYKILNDLYFSINDSQAIIYESGIEYRLNSMIKNDNDKVIAGRLSKIYKGEIERYDRQQNQPIPEQADDLSLSVNFCFDVSREIIAYTTPLGFGYKQFLYIFKDLIEAYIDDVEFELMLLTNIGNLKNKISALKKITEVSITLIPPNPPNRREFQELFGDRADEILESRGTKYHEIVEISPKSEDGINQGKLFDRGYEAAEKGYGLMSTKGIDDGNNFVTISSQTNAPLKNYISDNQKNNIGYILEKGRQFISGIARLFL